MQRFERSLEQLKRRFSIANKKRICYTGLAMVILTRADVLSAPPQQVTITCPNCSQQYRLNYSDDEWNRVHGWIAVATKAIREDHKRRHENSSIPLHWNTVRPR